MTEKKIVVIAYSGHRGEERPKTLHVHGEKIEVVEILDAWIEEGREHQIRKRCFRLTGSDGHTRVVCYDETLKEWFSV